MHLKESCFRYAASRWRTSSRGMSLIEVAFSMLIVFITVAVIFNMIGGPKSNSTQIDLTNQTSFFPSSTKYLEFKNKEFTIANSLIESVISGNPDPGKDMGSSCPIPLNRNGMSVYLNSNASLPPNFISPSMLSPVCQATFGSYPMIYRWTTRRVYSGNPVNWDDNVGTFGTVSVPKRVNPTGNAVEDDKSYNEYYVATLNMYSSAADAAAQTRSTFNIPFSFYYNNNEPESIQAKVATVVSVDQSSSMGELDSSNGNTQETGLPRIVIAGQALLDFYKTVEQDPFVSDYSPMGLSTYNNASIIRSVLKYPDGQYPNRSYTALKSIALCFRPYEDADPKCSSTGWVVPEGTTNLIWGLNESEPPPPIAGGTAGAMPIMNTAPVFNRMHDRVIIFISDGATTMNAAGASVLSQTTGDPIHGADSNKATIEGANKEIVDLARDLAANPSDKNGRVYIFTIGIMPEAGYPDKLLSDIAKQSPNGLYIPINNATQLVDALQQIETQFQIFALRRKTERFGFAI